MRVVKWGLILAAGVELWTLVMGVTRWYAHPTLQALFWFVTLIELAVLVLALRESRKRWLGQVGVGTLVALVAAPIVFGGSILFTTVLFPDYFETLRAMHESMLRAEGLAEPEIRAQVEAAAAMQTPIAQAAAGAIATVLTAVVASAVIGIFVRAKD